MSFSFPITTNINNNLTSSPLLASTFNAVPYNPIFSTNLLSPYTTELTPVSVNSIPLTGYPTVIPSSNILPTNILPPINNLLPTNLITSPIVSSVSVPLNDKTSILPSLLSTNTLLYTPITNVNRDVNLRMEMSNLFSDKFAYWVANSRSYEKLYTYVVCKDNKCSIGLDKDNKPEMKTMKLKYILELFTIRDMTDLIDRFCKLYRVNWWDLKKQDVNDTLKAYILSEVKHYMKRQLNK